MFYVESEAMAINFNAPQSMIYLLKKYHQVYASEERLALY